MTANRPASFLLAWFLAAATAGAAAAGQTTLLTGSDDAVWVIRRDEGASQFDLAVRKEGTWRWAQSGLSGRPAGAVAAGRQLHVLFAAPAGHVLFDQETHDQSTALNPEHAFWPAGAAPAALCEAPDPNRPAGRTVLAVVPRPVAPASRPAASRPATRPASAPASGPAPAVTTAPARAQAGPRHDLGLFRRSGARWVHLGDWPDRELRPGSGVFVAAVGESVYVLLSDAGGRPNALARWRDGTREELALSGPAASSPAVSMLAVHDRLIVVLTKEAQAPARRELLIGTFDRAQGTFQWLTMMQESAAATWPADSSPQVTRLGEQLALLWREGEALRFGLCSPQMGQLTLLGDVGVFDEPPLESTGEDLITYFMWGVLAAVFIPMFLLRPRGGPRPFVLPETVRTGNLGRRLLAAILDLAPINILVSVGFTLATSEAKRERLRQVLWQMMKGKEVKIPVEAAVLYMATLVLYVAYCTIMEARLGATPGKLLMKLRVVGNGGERADLRQCLLRNLLKIIELVSLRSLLFFLVFVIPLLTRYRQRLGDLLARTTVVDARFVPPPVPPSQGETPGKDDPPAPPDGPGGGPF